MDALVIIDVQNGPLEEGPHHDIDGVLARINMLAATFRTRKEPVIFVRHNGSAQGELFPGTREWELDSRLLREAGDLYLDKTANDSFYQTDLEAVLVSLKIDQVVICGCATDFCVNATIHNGLTRNFNITVVADAHSCRDRPGIKASTVIGYYNWLWGNLTPTKGSISIRKTAEIGV